MLFELLASVEQRVDAERDAFNLSAAFEQRAAPARVAVLGGLQGGVDVEERRDESILDAGGEQARDEEGEEGEQGRGPGTSSAKRCASLSERNIA